MTSSSSRIASSGDQAPVDERGTISNRTRSSSRRALIAGCLFAASFVAVPAAHASSTCLARNYAVAPLQSNVFYIDTQTNYLGSYVGFKVTNNTGAGQPALWMRLENFSGGQVRSPAAAPPPPTGPPPAISGRRT